MIADQVCSGIHSLRDRSAEGYHRDLCKEQMEHDHRRPEVQVHRMTDGLGLHIDEVLGLRKTEVLGRQDSSYQHQLSSMLPE